jgi:hypothetical protein
MRRSTLGRALSQSGAGSLLTIALLTGCAPTPAAPAAGPLPMASSPPVAAHLVAKYSRGHVRIRWQQVASADGYTIYLDGQAVSVAATASSYDFKTSAPGTHFVQVVTRRGNDVSFPATAHVDVPYPQPASAASAIPATPTAGPVTEAAPPTQTALAPPAQAEAQPTAAPATHVITGSMSVRGYARERNRHRYRRASRRRLVRARLHLHVQDRENPDRVVLRDHSDPARRPRLLI